MDILKRQRENIGWYILSNRLKNHVRKVKAVNLEKSRKIGVLFGNLSEKDFDVVNKFFNKLTALEHKVIALGCYHKDKEPPSYILMNNKINYLSKQDFNYIYLPKDKLHKEFIEQDFDILILADVTDSLPLHYMARLSKARFKVAPYNDERIFYDLMININKTLTLPFFLEQVVHYLSLINKKEKV